MYLINLYQLTIYTYTRGSAILHSGLFSLRYAAHTTYIYTWLSYLALGFIFVLPSLRPPAHKLLCRLGGLAPLQVLTLNPKP
jgi:hypothetical protein